MDALLEKLLTEGGALGTLVIVVWIFVKDRKDIARENREWMERLAKANESALERMMREHLEAREMSRLTIERNSVLMQVTTQTLEKNIAAIEKNTMATEFLSRAMTDKTVKPMTL